MKHSDYNELTRFIEAIGAGANMLWLLSLPSASTEIDDKRRCEIYDAFNTFRPIGLWRIPYVGEDNPNWLDDLIEWLDSLLSEAIKMMSSVEDEFYTEHRARADQGLKATADILMLNKSIDGFLASHEIVEDYCYTFGDTDNLIASFHFLEFSDTKVRGKCREWVNVAKRWYPDITGNEGEQEVEQAPDTQATPPKGAVSINPDREKLSKLFSKDYKQIHTGDTITRFDLFYNNISNAKLVAKDWARMAFAIQSNNKIVASGYNLAKGAHFTQFLMAFFDAIGAEPPKDKHRNKYEDYKETSIIESLLK